MTLDMAQSGQEFTVMSIYGGCKLRRMLQERGLTEGANIKVIKGQPGGPFIIEFRSSRIMLDGKCARKIIVGQGTENGNVPIERCGTGGHCSRHRHKGRWNGFKWHNQEV